LLASEGGVYGKFNLSNCCLQIDGEGKVIEEIKDRWVVREGGGPGGRNEPSLVCTYE
jgi:hypothetical protein